MQLCKIVPIFILLLGWVMLQKGVRKVNDHDDSKLSMTGTFNKLHGLDMQACIIWKMCKNNSKWGQNLQAVEYEFSMKPSQF